MSGLLLAELRRFRSRHLVRVLSLVALGGIALGTVIAYTERFELRSLPDVLLGTSFFIVVIGWVLGASFIGAEWHAGTVSTLLTWEPRRVRVIAAKVVACLASVLALSIALQAILAGALVLDAHLNGSTVGAGDWLSATIETGLRASVLATIAAGVGFAVAAVGRNTAAALGAGFGYVVIVENLVRGLRPQWASWLIADNAGLFLVASPADFPNLDRSPTGAGVYLVLVALVLLVAAAAAFRTRDVT